jgi:predicted HD superfamily hydrolase involved in NAD metabolism
MINTIKEKVYEKLKDHQIRYEHVIGVYETAVKLARKYNVDEEKAAIAALYHDYAKYEPIEEQIAHLELKVIKRYADTPVMYHALAAAHYVENDFMIKDQDILNAIRYHVWGRTEMSMLEKIIFISDYCEPNRKFMDTTYIFELAMRDIDIATEYCMKLTSEDIIKKEGTQHEDQISAYQYYVEVNRGKTK